ncbi:MAG: DUF4302 domain-containing protein [Prevotella sp.]|nr:DUF4302 domain-containing protein [Prevotella sp.]MBQ9646458.1 DUF4302 domain-containing protein [Prevotella sp.]
MKKIFFISLAFASTLGFYGCSGEEEDIFDASAAERLNAASDVYSERLTRSENGWAMQFYPTYDNEAPNGAGYLLLCRFNKDFSVDVSGYNFPNWREEWDAEDRRNVWKPYYFQEYRTSTSFWNIITDNGPVLSFNAYNSVMHYFSDPDYRSPDSEHGTGFGGDYEFIIVDAPIIEPIGDSYMILKGKKRGTYNLLTPVEKGVDYEDYLADINRFQTAIFAPTNPTSAFLILGDSTFIMEDAVNGLPSIYPEGSDKITTENFNPFIITKRGDDYYLRFRDAFLRDDMEGTLQDLRYVPAEDRFVCTENDLFTIEPHKAKDFFRQTYEAEHFYTLKYIDIDSSYISLKMSSLLNDCLNGMKEMNKKNIFSEPVFRYDAAKKVGIVSFKYQNLESAKEMQYEYEANFNNDHVTFTYKQATESYAENVSSRVQAVNKLLKEVLSQEFVVSAYDTQFNLSYIKLTSTSDPDLWFLLYY